MVIIKLFIGAVVFIALLDELIKQEMFGNDKEGLVKVGLLMVFEMWLLGG